MMLTGVWNESVKLGRVAPSMLLQETDPPRPPCVPGLKIGLCDLLGKNDNVFVNSMQNSNTITMITDTVNALDIDLGTLSIKAKHNWSNVDGFIGKSRMAGVSSAHPIPVDGGHVEILLEIPEGPGGGKEQYVDFVKVLQADGGVSR
jgi:hypothetical protein